MDDETTYDVAVIGAGAAGLQAAQTLGRMHRATIVFDSGRYRNAPALRMHNFLAHDGTPPAALRADARADAEAYDDVTFRDDAVTTIAGTLGAFRIETEDESPVRARRVLLATGVRDALPPIPGIAENFGDLIAHCPFCHGHEFAGKRVGILGASAHLPAFTAMVRPITADLVVLTDGAVLDDGVAAAVHGLGVVVVETPVRGVERHGDRLVVDLEATDALTLDGLFVTTQWTQSAPFAADLGLETADSGAVLIDGFGRTSLPGVYAAGDMAQGRGVPMPTAAVLVAASGGLLAAAACVQDDAFARVATLP